MYSPNKSKNIANENKINIDNIYSNRLGVDIPLQVSIFNNWIYHKKLNKNT